MENKEMLTRVTIHTGQQPSETQIQEIEAAAERPIYTDDDSPSSNCIYTL